MSASIRRNSLAGPRRANWAAANIAAGTAALTWDSRSHRRHLGTRLGRERGGANLIPAHQAVRQALKDVGALIEMETNDGRRAFLLKKEIAPVNPHASVEPIAGNRGSPVTVFRDRSRTPMSIQRRAGIENWLAQAPADRVCS